MTKASYGISYNGTFYERNEIEIGVPRLHSCQRVCREKKQSRTEQKRPVELHSDKSEC